MNAPLEKVAPGTPPSVTGPEAHYLQSLAEGRWQVQRCNACARVIFYPRTACPQCGCSDYAWFSPSGRGVVHSTTVMRRPPAAGGDLHLCLVDLDEGFRMMSRVEGVEPTLVAIGDPVTATLIEQAGTQMVVFRRAGEGA